MSSYSFSSPLHITRHPHDARHPFTVISNTLIQGSLEPAARMLLIWLLSLPPGWKTSLEAIRYQFCPGSVIGEHRLRGWVKELETKGHLMRHQEKEGTRFGRVLWYVSETPQKKFPDVENQQTAHTAYEQEKCPHTQSGPLVDFPRAEDQGLRNTEGKKTEEKKLILSSASGAADQRSEILAQEFFDLLKAKKADIRLPSLAKTSKAFDLMLRRDNRSESDIRAVMAWALSHHFWSSNILSAEKLRAQFDQLSLKMVSEADQRDYQENLDLVRQAMSAGWPISVVGKWVKHTKKRDKELSLLMKHDAFVAAFRSWND